MERHETAQRAGGSSRRVDVGLDEGGSEHALLALQIVDGQFDKRFGAGELQFVLVSTSANDSHSPLR